MNRIAQAVRASGRSGVYLATKLGMTQPAFSDRMRGRTPWTLADAIAIADDLGVSLDGLVGREDLPIGYIPTTREDVPA